MGAVKKVGITVASLLLIVGCVIGIVAIVKHTKYGSSISTSQKTVEAICAPTQFKDACQSSLQSVVDKKDASISDYLMAAVESAMTEVKKAMNATSNVVVDKHDDPHNDAQGIDNCKDFLQQTIGQLQAAISSVGNSDIHSIEQRTEEFISWLTGAYIYQKTCVDEMDAPKYKSAVEDGMVDATQLTENALYIFAKIRDVLDMLHIPESVTNFVGNATNKISEMTSRRLLESGHGSDDYYSFPQWVSNGDRKLLAAPGVTPNIVVAQDGSGQFRTVTEAVNAVPAGNTQRFVIYIKAGIYKETILMKGKSNVFFLGDGQGKTVITNNLCFTNGVKTSASATVGIDSDFFMARGITFENSAGWVGHQAVALRINGEKAVIFECEIKSYQDTLYYHKGLQFYKNCIISGTVDFIFGNGRAIIQDSLLIVRMPGPSQQNMLTADGGLTPVGEHGLVIQNCKITAEPQLFANRATVKTFLGRPWKAYAVTIFIRNDIDDFIAREGYSIFTNVGPESQNQKTCFYAEFENRGGGAYAEARDRVNFPRWKFLSPQEADGFTVGRFIDGNSWLPASGVPFRGGLN